MKITLHYIAALTVLLFVVQWQSNSILPTSLSDYIYSYLISKEQKRTFALQRRNQAGFERYIPVSKSSTFFLWWDCEMVFTELSWKCPGTNFVSLERKLKFLFFLSGFHHKQTWSSKENGIQQNKHNNKFKLIANIITEWFTVDLVQTKWNLNSSPLIRSTKILPFSAICQSTLVFHFTANFPLHIRLCLELQV